MNISFEINNRVYQFDASKPFDVSIPLEFNGTQPNAFGVETATATACETGDFIGDTRRGGSCNFEEIKFIPHCNGTHTESIGHITDERISVRDCLQDAFVLANLISVETENAQQTGETYAVNLDEKDFLITRRSIENALEKIHDSRFNIQDFIGLIVRTLPNDDGKKARRYMEKLPPFFSIEAMKLIASLNIKHLLVDTPSIDRTFDEGKLANHRIFWNVAPHSKELNAESLPQRTITEMVYVSNEVADGAYLLNLQIAPFASDAAPSRPILFEIR